MKNQENIMVGILTGMLLFVTGAYTLPQNIFNGTILIILGSTSIVLTPQGPEKAIAAIKFAPILLKELYESMRKIK